jgi:hypothetical protein
MTVLATCGNFNLATLPRGENAQSRSENRPCRDRSRRCPIRPDGPRPGTDQGVQDDLPQDKEAPFIGPRRGA